MEGGPPDRTGGPAERPEPTPDPPTPTPRPPSPEPPSPETPSPESRSPEPPAPASAGEPEDRQTVGELVLEISEQATVLVREEIELAKTELSEKFNKLLAGSVAGVIAGVFLLAALILLMHAFAIVLGDNFFDGRVWLGYLVEAIIFIAVAAGAGLYAYRSIKRGSPPMPEMAIEEAREIRAAFEGPEGETR